MRTHNFLTPCIPELHWHIRQISNFCNYKKTWLANDRHPINLATLNPTTECTQFHTLQNHAPHEVSLRPPRAPVQPCPPPLRPQRAAPLRQSGTSQSQSHPAEGSRGEGPTCSVHVGHHARTARIAKSWVLGAGSSCPERAGNEQHFHMDARARGRQAKHGKLCAHSELEKIMHMSSLNSITFQLEDQANRGSQKDPAWVEGKHALTRWVEALRITGVQSRGALQMLSSC